MKLEDILNRTYVLDYDYVNEDDDDEVEHEWRERIKFEKNDEGKYDVNVYEYYDKCDEYEFLHTCLELTKEQIEEIDCIEDFIEENCMDYNYIEGTLDVRWEIND